MKTDFRRITDLHVCGLTVNTSRTVFRVGTWKDLEEVPRVAHGMTTRVPSSLKTVATRDEHRDYFATHPLLLFGSYKDTKEVFPWLAVPWGRWA